MRSWLVLDGPARGNAAALQGFANSARSGVVDVAVLDLPGRWPVATDAPGAIAAAARKVEGARVLDENELRTAVGARVQASSVSFDRGTLVVNRVLRVEVRDVATVYALQLASGPALALARTSGSLVVIARSSCDLSALAPGASADEAFSRFAAGLPQLLGRPVDATLLSPAAASILRLVDDPLDVVDLACCAHAPPVHASAGASAVASAVAPDPSEIINRKCQSCSAVVTSSEGYTVFEQPMCANCADKYVDGHARRAAILAAVFCASLALFFALTWNFDFIGRAIGALIVIVVFRTVLATGVQYDVDVDRGLGTARTRVRKSGFFKLWGDLDSKWWGKWLLHRGVFVALGLLAWFTPIGGGHAFASSHDDDEKKEEEQAEQPRFTTVELKPLAGTAAKDGLRLELVEVRSDGDVPVLIVDASRGEQQQKLTLRLDEKRGQTTFGVRWTILEVHVPPDPPSLVLTFDDVGDFFD